MADAPHGKTWHMELRQFKLHLDEKKWNGTRYQVYLNNKGKLNSTDLNPWVLDEPTEYWDYRALAYYGDLVQKARGERCPVTVDR